MEIKAVLLAATGSVMSISTEYPVKRAAVDQPTQYTWTFQQFQRECTTNGQQCAYSFNINENDGQPAHPCQVKTTATSEILAYRGDHFDLICGAYNVNTHWNNTFGDDRGFTDFAIVRAPYITYPAYSDTELNTGIAFGSDHAPYPVFIAGP